MKLLNTKTKVEIAVMIAATAVLAAGCCTKKETAYNAPPPPVEAGAPPVPVQTEAVSTANSGVIPLEKEQLNVGTQQVQDGSVRIRKFVTTQTVTQPVTVRSESVSIERLPAGAAPPAGAPTGAAGGELNKPFQEGEMVINLQKEQPVVSTQVVPNGSVVVNKQETSQTVNVQGQVRSEDVTATSSGNPQNVRIQGVPEAAPGAPGAPGAATGAPPQPYGQATGGGGQPITTLDQLTTSSDPTSMAGQPVDLSNVPVQRVVGSHIIVIGSGGTPIYVHLAQPVSGLSPGQMVSVNGVVQQTQGTPQGWDQQSAQALQGQKIYIDARSVTPATQ